MAQLKEDQIKIMSALNNGVIIQRDSSFGQADGTFRPSSVHGVDLNKRVFRGIQSRGFLTQTFTVDHLQVPVLEIRLSDKGKAFMNVEVHSA